MLKIVKNIRYLKLLTNYKLKPDDKLKFQINHSIKNIIDIDKLLFTEDAIKKDRKQVFFKQRETLVKTSTFGLKDVGKDNKIDEFIIKRKIKKEK